jgi:hypothetical protein
MSTHEWEDKYIRQELESLQNLKPAHLPNLDSKWALLETSLAEQRRNRKKMVWILRAAAVLAILLFSSTLLLIETMGSKAEDKLLPTAVLSETHREKIVPGIPPQKAERTAAQKRERRVAQKTDQRLMTKTPPFFETTSVVMANDSAVIVKKDTTQVLVKTQTVKRPARVRYIEMDFGDVSESSPPAPAPAYAAGWQISIKSNAHQSKSYKQESDQLKTLGFKF